MSDLQSVASAAASLLAAHSANDRKDSLIRNAEVFLHRVDTALRTATLTDPARRLLRDARIHTQLRLAGEKAHGYTTFPRFETGGPFDPFAEGLAKIVALAAPGGTAEDDLSNTEKAVLRILRPLYSRGLTCEELSRVLRNREIEVGESRLSHILGREGKPRQRGLITHERGIGYRAPPRNEIASR
jgi:hypothetical protein